MVGKELKIPKPDPSLPGKTCQGYMDYDPETPGWSNCDVAEMNTYFNSLTEKEFNECLKPLKGDNL